MGSNKEKFSILVHCIKWIVAYIAVWFHNYYHRKRFHLYDVNAIGNPLKLGYIYPEVEKRLESPFPESHLEEFTDEVLFYGVNSKSECLVVRIARGRNGGSEAWIYLKLADGRTFVLSEPAGHQQPSEDAVYSSFTCGRLQMHYLAPMRRWRIAFCGMLRESKEKDSTEEVFVKFVFIWRASFDVYDLTLSTYPKGFVRAITKYEWPAPFMPPVKRVAEALDFYAQPGVLNGEVSINDGPNYQMYFFGERTRNLGKLSNTAGSSFINLVGCIPESGSSFHISKATTPNLFENLAYGYFIPANGSFTPVREAAFITDTPQKAIKKLAKFKTYFSSNGIHKLSGTMCKPVELCSNQAWRGVTELSYIQFTLGGKKGYGLFFAGECYEPAKMSFRIERPVSIPNPVPSVVQFTDKVSHLGFISGGKGSSLGKLTKLTEELNFIVPKGLVVTIAAYSEFVTSKILNAVKRLEDVSYGNLEGDVKEECNNVGDVIIKTIFPKKIRHTIMVELKEVFNKDVNSMKFAVRSSATGEDSSALSAAGQMVTLLGIQGMEEIILAVKKCWASQFGHTAVEYKKRHGQMLNSPMAVVIQEMVPCEVSGVLFTCDPVTNNPSVITITANYGLGESVVSASVEPDTIILRKRESGQLTCDEINIGTKQHKTVMKDSGGTVTEAVDEISRKEGCLSKDMALRLAKLAIQIENHFKSSRDIEWGVLENDIYILQSRPVTNISSATDFEIKHEFDDHLRCEKEYYSVCNVGEILPLAVSPLGMDTVTNFWSSISKREAMAKGFNDVFFQCKYYNSGVQFFCNHMLLTIMELMVRYGYGTLKSKGFEISICGRLMDDPDLIKDYKERYECPVKEPTETLRHHIHYYWDLFFHDRQAKRIGKSINDYQSLFLKTTKSTECFQALLKSCSDFDHVGQMHIDSTESSSTWNMLMFKVLYNAKGSLDSEVYGDFARLLARSSKGKNADVESADVPRAMQELAMQIEKDIDNEDFKSMSVEEAEAWLQCTESATGRKFRSFLERHGHRCLNEFDIYAVTWKMYPKRLVELLQKLVGASKVDAKKEEDGFDTIFNDLNVKMDFKSKCKLKFILPNCCRAVRAREAAKSCLIKAFEHWRRGYRHLGKLMQSEGRLPSEDLVFFLTVNEIDEILKTRSPNLVSRAIYRKQMFPKVDKYKFPELMKGLPKPIYAEDEESSETYEFVADLTMKGIPVSQGVAKGYARVAITLEEAAELKQGEILITYSTDIGWSPYFSIISGVVTELGGLISHGAVVSREYGLPCVVGLAGAAKRFQTGDYVLLDGKKGILQRLPVPEK